MPRRKIVRPYYYVRESYTDDNGKFVSTKKKRVYLDNTEASVESADVPPSTDLPPSQPVVVSQGPSTYVVQRLRDVDAWATLRPKFLSACVEEEAPRDLCKSPGCDKSAESRCRDCGPSMHYCIQCNLDCHRAILYHRPELYDETKGYRYMVITSVIDLPADHQCDGRKYYRDLCVWDAKGRMHQHSVAFCECEAECVTLVRNRLWPATTEQPRVAFHFELLDWWEALQLEGQLSTLAFCNVLRWRNRDTSKELYEPLYKQLVQDTVDEYRHFKFQWRNVVHQQTYDCPACPKDEGNIFVSMDGCFSLVKRVQDACDISPLHDNKLFLNQPSVDTFVENYGLKGGPDNPGECNDFNAGDKIRSTSTTRKLPVTGVFGSCCRHEIPMTFCDLRHGERFAYAVNLLTHLKTQGSSSTRLHVLYDIACSFGSHIQRHCPDLADIPLAIPIFHAYGHKTSCQMTLNPKRLQGFGHVDGESMERLWSYLGKFSKITKEMTAGRRKDLLTDALLHFRSKKLETLNATTCCRLDKAQKLKHLSWDRLQELISLCNAGDSVTTLDSVQQWYHEEQNAQSASTTAKKQSLTWDEKYVQTLDELRAARILITQPDEDGSQLSKKVNRLEKTLQRLKKNVTENGSWEYGSTNYQCSKKSMVNKRRHELLNLMRNYACDIWYISHLKSKYSGGQKVAKKLGKQQASASSSLRKCLDRYNAVCRNFFPAVQIGEVNNPDAIIYQESLTSEVGESRPSSALRREMIDAWLIHERASEEISYIKKEMQDIIAYFKTLLNNVMLLDNINEDCNHSENYRAGMHQIILKKMQEINFIIEECTEKFQKHLDVSCIVEVDAQAIDIEDYYSDDNDSDDNNHDENSV